MKQVLNTNECIKYAKSIMSARHEDSINSLGELELKVTSVTIENELEVWDLKPVLIHTKIVHLSNGYSVQCWLQNDGTIYGEF